jgi:hypothetical protein
MNVAEGMHHRTTERIFSLVYSRSEVRECSHRDHSHPTSIERLGRDVACQLHLDHLPRDFSASLSSNASIARDVFQAPDPISDAGMTRVRARSMAGPLGA